MESDKTLNIVDIFGSLVFDDAAMKERLPEQVFFALQNTRQLGQALDADLANTVANAMKDWAIGKGATHYTHWFHPMTNLTAEKHDAFISQSEDGKVIMELSGRALMVGETDASSLPSGGMRSTFEARGYMAWDPTSYAFIKEDTLCIPSVFCTYGGQSMDKKMPLLKSIEAINAQTLRILRLFGNTSATHVIANIGAEQEYFLIDNEQFLKRKDLRFTGRTLFGAPTPKDQETAAHYFGAIRPRVSAFMRDLDVELWKLGIAAKTEHNETAPAQHELAPIYTNANMATDHNQITMELMRKVAERHGLACLLHEKPFAGINGSGKHNNWSLSTNDGQNLLEPGDSPAENAQFLLFLCAVIQAVDEYASLLRVAVATAGNDNRLGGNEAPPTVISIYLGDELSEVLQTIEAGVVGYVTEQIDAAGAAGAASLDKEAEATSGAGFYEASKASKERREGAYSGYVTEQIDAAGAASFIKDKPGRYLEIGVSSLPKFRKDTTDRNRTSPFAFTGNKFEFRMTGSSASIAGVNFILNVIVAEVLRQFADELEGAESFRESLHNLIARTIIQHKRILFSGNNYAEGWYAEAKERGLPDYPSAVAALPHFLDKENVDVLTRHHIFTEEEIRFRLDILLESYSQTISVEALTMLDIGRQEILPAVLAFSKSVSEGIVSKKATGLALDMSYDTALLEVLCEEAGLLYEALNELEAAQKKAACTGEALAQAQAWRELVAPAMDKVRAPADRLEAIVGKAYWPFPTYADILFSV
ncbi:MAG: glutamine synthetase III [Clostridiales bacterium]|nr:glutamine synthetase III [Clostridiales bacterium]